MSSDSYGTIYPISDFIESRCYNLGRIHFERTVAIRNNVLVEEIVRPDNDPYFYFTGEIGKGYGNGKKTTILTNLEKYAYFEDGGNEGVGFDLTTADLEILRKISAWALEVDPSEALGSWWYRTDSEQDFEMVYEEMCQHFSFRLRRPILTNILYPAIIRRGEWFKGEDGHRMLNLTVIGLG